MAELKLPALDPGQVAEVRGSGYPEPFRSRMGNASWRALGDHFGITQFGVSYETLEASVKIAMPPR